MDTPGRASSAMRRTRMNAKRVVIKSIVALVAIVTPQNARATPVASSHHLRRKNN
jgi:hypothetical protein